MEKEKVRVLFAGDFCAQNPGEIKISKELKNIMEASDIKCLNFEGPLAVGKPRIIKGSALLPQSDYSPKWCEESGFNVISLANNHARDYGSEGLEQTINAFNNSITTGAGLWEDAYKIKYMDVKGLRIGFFSATQADFASLKDKWTDLGVIGCAWINHYEVNMRVADAKKNCDFLFVMPHAGVEYINIPLPEWRDRYQELIHYGADAIIAAHPHIPQGWEVINGKPIFYSLGNFFFDRRKNPHTKPAFWDNGLLVQFDIDKTGISFKTTSVVKNGNNLGVDCSAETQQHLSKVNKILLDHKSYMNEVNQEVLLLWKRHEGVLLRGFNAQKVRLNWKSIAKILYSLLILKPKYKLVLGYLSTESHRYVMIRSLRLIYKSL